MKKVAILMMIHKYTWQQRALIRHLSNDFDIYIHIDKKSDIDRNEVESSGKNVKAYKKYKVYWGHHSQFFASLFILKKAYKVAYERYVFISGEDIPLKSNAEIISFFSKNKKEYINYEKLPIKGWAGGGFARVDYFYFRNLFVTKPKILRVFFNKVVNVLNHFLISLMKVFNLHRRLDIQYYGGSSWWNLTHNCVGQILRYLVENPSFLKKFKYTSCADEIFFQTLILNFIKNLTCENNNLRYIDWSNCESSPHIFTIRDFPKLKESPALFARKFDCTLDSEIIKECFKRISSRSPESE